jgi:hypothetical protein
MVGIAQPDRRTTETGLSQVQILPARPIMLIISCLHFIFSTKVAELSNIFKCEVSFMAIHFKLAQNKEFSLNSFFPKEI